MPKGERSRRRTSGQSALDALRTPHGLRPIRKLGQGGFGAVFEVALDGGRRLALKRLARVDAESIYRFKQEFRVLAGRRHDNLVRLHELYADGDTWSFTMDLVEGVPFDLWVRGQARPEVETADTLSSQNPSSSVQVFESAVPPPAFAPEAESLLRLRRALAQLVRGVLALHDDGILHRDLKPSNVLVDVEGHVTILDFGLALLASGPDADQMSTAGTPTYMSPEQGRGAALTMASDWYAVGVMLYQALVGHPPFAGSASDILSAKRTRRPRDPRQLVSHLPDDLCDLALALLEREPSERPTGFAVARSLGLSTSLAASPRHVLEGTFVGRERQMRALQHAYDTMREGSAVVAHVHGRSGLGKTTLVRQFVLDLSLRGEVIVLQGRCFERESVPFKAVDDLVDALGRHLSQLKPLEAAGFMPRDAQALIRLFPSLGRLDFLSSSSGRPASGDAFELRRRAFTAFREILTRLTDTRPVVLVLEDVHWGDRDSAELIRHLLAPPDVPPLLLIATARSGMKQESELLRILHHPQAMDSAWSVIEVEVGPLGAAEGTLLAQTLLEATRASGFDAAEITKEAAGSPLLIAELIRAALRLNAPAPISLADVIEQRRRRLAPNATQLLELLSASDRPLPLAALALALDRSEAEARVAVTQLCDEHLATMTLSRGRTEYETSHDRIRLTVLDAIEDQRRVELHTALARALRATDAEPEMVFTHFIAAGHRYEAAVFAEKAGDRASSGTAFEQAAALYGTAVDLIRRAGLDAEGVERKWARAAAKAGHCEEAGRIYTELAARGVADSAHLQRLAGEQLLRAGLVREGLQILERALNDAGLSPPRTPSSALAAILYRRTRLKWRGLRIKAPVPVSERDAHVMDLCWVLGNGLTGIDVIRSVHYHALGLWLALESTDRRRIARALALNAALSALESRQSADRADSTLSQAESLAEECGDAQAKGWAIAGRALQAWTRTELETCVDCCERAISQLRLRSEETFREIGSLEVWFLLHAAFLLGRLDQVAARAPACAREAEMRGDRYTNSTVRAYVLPLLWAARGDLEEARRDAERALEPWPMDAWYHQHWAHLRAMCFLDLFEGKGERILQRTVDARPKMKAAMHLRLRTPRLELNYLEGRGALEELRRGNDERASRRFVALVRERIERLNEENAPLATAYAMALSAGCSSWQGAEDARERWQVFRDFCEELKMALHVAAASLRLHQIDRGGAVPASHSAVLELEQRGVVDVARFVDLLVPRLALATEIEQDSSSHHSGAQL